MELQWSNSAFTFFLLPCLEFTEHTQDKHIQRDDEYYEGDHDNDNHTDDA